MPQPENYSEDQAPPGAFFTHHKLTETGETPPFLFPDALVLATDRLSDAGHHEEAHQLLDAYEAQPELLPMLLARVALLDALHTELTYPPVPFSHQRRLFQPPVDDL